MAVAVGECGALRSSRTIALQGTGTAPALSVSDTSVDFGGVALGTSQTYAFTLTNSGTADLHVTSIGGLTGANGHRNGGGGGGARNDPRDKQG